MGTRDLGFQIDYGKFRIYLKDKYGVSEAYYFLGFLNEDNQGLYTCLQGAGFIVVFREHSSGMDGKKKGNVDTDIVFEMMRNVLENKDFEKIVLVSGDGDYFKMVRYLIEKERFLKILFPNKKFASSLYKKIAARYYDYIENIRTRIEYQKGRQK